MFESLSDKLSGTLRKLRGVGKLSEENMAEALKEVRTALLAADEDVLKAIEPHLEALRQGLETAARVAVDPEVAALATKLATCMTTPS